jgi:hypothetical protein
MGILKLLAALSRIHARTKELSMNEPAHHRPEVAGDNVRQSKSVFLGNAFLSVFLAVAIMSPPFVLLLVSHDINWLLHDPFIISPFLF